MTESDFLFYRLFFNNWTDIVPLSTSLYGRFFMHPVFYKCFNSFTENNSFGLVYNDVFGGTDRFSILGDPLDHFVFGLVYRTSDVFGFHTYLSGLETFFYYHPLGTTDY